jgi:hypothetical protein
MLSKLAYLRLCRSIQLLALLAHGEATRDLEILVLPHQLMVLRRQTPRPRLEPADRAVLAAVSRALPRARWSCFLVKPETLLRWHRRLVAGAWTHPARQTGRPPLDNDIHQLIIRLARERPTRATSASRRTSTAWRADLGDRDPHDAAPPRARPGTAAGEQHLAGVPSPASRRDRGLRLLHRRHRLAATVVGAVLHRAGHPAGSRGRRNRQSQRRMGHPAGAQPIAGHGGTRMPAGLPCSRSGCEVLARIR